MGRDWPLLPAPSHSRSKWAGKSSSPGSAWSDHVRTGEVNLEIHLPWPGCCIELGEGSPLGGTLGGHELNLSYGGEGCASPHPYQRDQSPLRK